MMHLIPVLRPDRTLLWLPPGLAARLGLEADDILPPGLMNDREIQALLASRIACNDAKGHCTAEWHEQNGYL